LIGFPNYAVNGLIDAEGAELLGTWAYEAGDVVNRYKTPEAKAYFSECSGILAAIKAVALKEP
jgi:hypothetical protein